MTDPHGRKFLELKAKVERFTEDYLIDKAKEDEKIRTLAVLIILTAIVAVSAVGGVVFLCFK